MLIAIFRAVQSTGERPSVNAIMACVRRHGHAFRDSDAKAAIRTVGPRPGTDPPVPAPQIVLVGTDPPVPAPPRPRLRGRARISKDLVKAGMESNTSLDRIADSLRSSGDSGEVKKSEAEGSQQPSWVIELRQAASAIANTTMRDLTLEERSVCGRYHAFRFENCTRSEARNVKAGAKAAVAFAKMADSQIFADFTVMDYCDHAVVYQRDFMRGAPFYDPFAIRAVIEAKKSPERRR